MHCGRRSTNKTQWKTQCKFQCIKIHSNVSSCWEILWVKVLGAAHMLIFRFLTGTWEHHVYWWRRDGQNWFPGRSDVKQRPSRGFTVKCYSLLYINMSICPYGYEPPSADSQCRVTWACDDRCWKKRFINSIRWFVLEFYELITLLLIILDQSLAWVFKSVLIKLGLWNQW